MIRFIQNVLQPRNTERAIRSSCLWMLKLV